MHRPRAMALVCPLLAMLFVAGASGQTSRPKPATRSAPKPTSHTTKTIEGWTVHIDNRLLADPNRAIGEKAIKLLTNRLADIVRVVPSDKIEWLAKVPIVLDLTNGALLTAQYHPSAGWLRDNGYDPSLAHCVHIPDAAYFASGKMSYEQPWAVLHELSHAYHDQVLGFDEPRIKNAWKAFVASGKYKSVPHMNGRMREHYGLTNQMEFFAEMTETYFGMNDFFPFNSTELRREEPSLFQLMHEIWGKLPNE